jgi:hypothetical protein
VCEQARARERSRQSGRRSAKQKNDLTRNVCTTAHLGKLEIWNGKGCMPLYPLKDFESSKRKVVIGLLAIAVSMLPLLGSPATRGISIVPIASAQTRANQAVSGIYTTKFPLTENPISDGGNWINNKAVGLDWADVQTTPGLAFGTQSGSNGYDDSTALLTGTWRSDQTVEAAVHSVNQNDNIYEEVELRLRSSLSAHKATGYEINFRCSKTANAYTQIVRWNGPLGNFTYLDSRGGSKYGVANGDTVKATIVGNVITVYINGAQVLQATDNTFASGSPGMGFFLQGATGVNGDFGFTDFSASDGSAPPAPTNLSASPH